MGEIKIKPAYTVNEFCADFGIGRSKAYEEVRLGKLATFRIGNRVLISGEEAMRWLAGYRDAPQVRPQSQNPPRLRRDAGGPLQAA